MKTIKPIKILNKQAVYLDTYLIMDNLKDSCTFHFNLLDETGINSVYTGNVLMQGSEYDNWTDNDYAWDYVAMELGIEFISN